MSRKFIVAIAAVAALGLSTLATTDASARFGGGGGHFAGGQGGGGHATSFSRASFHPARISTSRTVTRTTRTTHVNRYSRVNRPTPNRPNHNHFARLHHGHHWWWACRHHHGYRCGYPWIDVGVDGVAVDGVADVQTVAATPAAVCSDCDYFLKDEPGCYMAKRAFSTPAGDELRCVKICEEPEPAHAAK
jgi:hypothetical protein